MNSLIKKLTGVALLAGAVWVIPSAMAHGGNHGHQQVQTFNYTFYPEVGVYFSADRGVWFWQSHKQWQHARKLPKGLRHHVGRGFTIVLNDHHPRRHFVQHQARHHAYRHSNRHGHHRNHHSERGHGSRHRNHPHRG